jgi:hypothetical protein
VQGPREMYVLSLLLGPCKEVSELMTHNWAFYEADFPLSWAPVNEAYCVISIKEISSD